MFHIKFFKGSEFLSGGLGRQCLQEARTWSQECLANIDSWYLSKATIQPQTQNTETVTSPSLVNINGMSCLQFLGGRKDWKFVEIWSSTGVSGSSEATGEWRSPTSSAVFALSILNGWKQLWKHMKALDAWPPLVCLLIRMALALLAVFTFFTFFLCSTVSFTSFPLAEPFARQECATKHNKCRKLDRSIWKMLHTADTLKIEWPLATRHSYICL